MAVDIDNAELNSSTATTQSPADNSTKVATTAYADAVVPGLTGGDGITYSAGTISADINTTNLQFTTNEINTIQDIDSTASPTFNNLRADGNIGVGGAHAATTGLFLQDSNEAGILMAGTRTGGSTQVGVALAPTHAPAVSMAVINGLEVLPILSTAAVVTVTDYKAITIDGGSTGGNITVTNAWGLYVNAPVVATNNYGAYLGGPVGVNNTTPAKDLDVTGTAAISSTVTLSGLTADSLLALDSGKDVINPTIGTGLTYTSDTLSISTSYVGQTSITTLGTITTGTWNGTAIADAYVDNNLTISGGTVDNSTIGATTPSTGAFTTLAVDTSLVLGDGSNPGVFQIPDLFGNPKFSVVADTNNAAECAIINNWGNSSNTGFLTGTTRSDGIAFQVRSGVTLTSGLPNDTGTSQFRVAGGGDVFVETGQLNVGTGTAVDSNVAINATSGIGWIWLNPDRPVAAARNWGLHINNAVEGSLEFYVSTSNTGDPATNVANFTRDGDFLVNATSTNYGVEFRSKTFYTTNNTSSLPTSDAGGGVAVSWNKSGGSAEVNYYNVFNNAAWSHQWHQKTGASTQYTIMTCGTWGLMVGTTTNPTGTTGSVVTLGDNGGNPTMGTNTAGVFAKDVSGTVELFAIDEASNVTQLSPHDSEGYWVYNSYNGNTGRKVKVDLERFFMDYDDKHGTSYYNESKELK